MGQQTTGSGEPVDPTSGASPAPPEPWAPAVSLPPPAPPQRRWWQGTAGSWLIRIGIIAAIAIGALVLRDRLSGAATELRVGDCFDEPNADTSVVEDVQHQPCGDAHDAEVVFVGDYPSQDAYPGQDAFDSFGATNCIPAFEGYVGRDWETDSELDMGMFFPIEDGWSDGDHEITCYVYRIDDAKLVTSVKAAP